MPNYIRCTVKNEGKWNSKKKNSFIIEYKVKCTFNIKGELEFGRKRHFPSQCHLLCLWMVLDVLQKHLFLRET